MRRTPAWLALSAVGAMVILEGSTTQAQTFDVKLLEVEKGVLEYGPENMFARGVPREQAYGAVLHPVVSESHRRVYVRTAATGDRDGGHGASVDGHRR